MQILRKNSSRLVGVGLLWVLATPAMAQIYRCDTPQGTEYSDEPCGDEARVVTIEEDSSGIEIGPSEEVREYLDQARQERAEERERAAELARSAPPPQPPPVVYYEPERYVYPAYWPFRPNHRPPHHRPPGHGRPPGHRPERPPRPEPETPPSTLKPR